MIANLLMSMLDKKKRKKQKPQKSTN